MNRLKQFRIDLHQIPETAFEEFKTHAYLVKELSSLGFKTKTYLETDVVVFIDKKADKTIAFRSDIDGLPQDEKTNLDYASIHPNRMHACGHDGHMAMLLEFAHYLKSIENDLNVNVLLIFQPAEEKIGGAKKLIEKGLFKDYPVDAIYGIHLYPEIEEGMITSMPGTMMASPNELTIRFKGKGSHGAMPHLGIDANHMASLYLTLVYQEISQLNQEETVICTFGKIEGGSGKNIIAETAYLEGTMRTFNKKAFNKVKNILEGVAQNIEERFKGSVDVIIHDGYLPVVNDNRLYQSFVKTLGDIPFKALETPLLIGEDFSFYQEKVPGLFFFVGVRNEAKGYIHSLHSSSFNFDEKALETGVLAYIKTIHSWMV